MSAYGGYCVCALPAPDEQSECNDCGRKVRRAPTSPERTDTPECNCWGVYRDPDFVGHRVTCPKYVKPERPDTERDAAPKVLGDAELAAIKERATMKSPTGTWLVDADIALLLVSHAALRASLADAQTTIARTQSALEQTNIGGIFDVFGDPADAITQMALHIRDLGVLIRTEPYLADAQTNAARFSALAALCDRKAGAIRMRRWVGSTREDVITSSAALATVADELRAAGPEKANG